LKLALFDLDNTLLAGDSDYLWGEYLCEHNYVDAAEYHAGHDRFYRDYLAGKLDMDAFLQFQLGPLAGKSLAELEDRRRAYIDSKIRPVILERGRELIRRHRDEGHTLMIITATNRFLTAPIAKILEIDNLIATETELQDGRFTGRSFDVPSYREGKVMRLRAWLQQQEASLCESWFYSDSHNDIPLLEFCDHAVAVDPDDRLRAHAGEHNWPIISLRDSH
jgi:HAD superfamily hydrolase (TIGR01490 family)